MKKRVELSKYSVGITFLSIIALGGILCWNLLSQRESEYKSISIWALVSCIILWCLLSLYYAPLWIKITDDKLEIVRSLRIKVIPFDQIRSVRLCPPTMAEKRLCGSGGFVGYWGWFSERDLGKYFAYYGKSSDCFLVTLRSGRKYMLGCKDAKEMVAAINEKIQS